MREKRGGALTTSTYQIITFKAIFISHLRSIQLKLISLSCKKSDAGVLPTPLSHAHLLAHLLKLDHLLLQEERRECIAHHASAERDLPHTRWGFGSEVNL